MLRLSDVSSFCVLTNGAFMTTLGSIRAILAACCILSLNLVTPLSAAMELPCASHRPDPSAGSDIGKLGKETLNEVAISESFVTTSAELRHVLESPAVPATLFLCPGTYAALDLRDLRFDPPVTLRSADPAKPARLTGLRLHAITGLHFEQVNFIGIEPMQRHSRPFQFVASDNIRFKNVRFLGAQEQAHPMGQALFVRDSKNIAILSSEIRFWHRAAVFTTSAHITIRNTHIADMTSDGLNFSAVSFVVIEGNTIRDFRRDLSSDDHADMIQFWTRGTTRASRDILVRNNTLDAGTGLFTQSIFMRNEVMDRDPTAWHMAYRNVRVINNTIRNAHLHGISVGQSSGLTIRGNRLFRHGEAARPGASLGHSTPAIRVHPDSRGVMISQNVTTKVAGHKDQRDWTLQDNLAPGSKSLTAW